MTPAPATVTLSNRLTLSYVEQGDRKAPAVVLLHGLTDSWRSFAEVLPHLPASIRALAPTQRGHGDSEKPEDGYRISDFVSDLVDFLDRLQVTPTVVVGHSSHGLVALRLAIDHPDRVAGLVLASSFAALRGNTTAEEFVASTVPTIRDPVGIDFVRAFQKGTFVRPVPQSFLDAVVADTMKVPAAVWRAAFQGLLEEDLTEQLPSITVPTLLIWGDRDTLITRDRQDLLAARIRHAELIVYEGVGHSPHWEEPMRFAADLSAFLNRLGRAAERPA